MFRHARKFLLCLLFFNFIGISALGASLPVECRILYGDLERYLKGEPKILTIDSMPASIGSLLEKHQSLISMLLRDTSGQKEAEYSQNLSKYKLLAPSIQRHTGESEHRDKRISDSGTFSVTGSVDGIVDGYYTSLQLAASGQYTNYEHYYREVTKASDPSLYSVIENLTANATVDDLELYIDAMSMHWKKWNRRTVSMRNQGTAGVMKVANRAYLTMLDMHIKNFEFLHETIINDKNDRLKLQAEWTYFKKNEGVILSDYLKNSSKEICISSSGSFRLPGDSQFKRLILKFPSSETLFIDVSSGVVPIQNVRVFKL